MLPPAVRKTPALLACLLLLGASAVAAAAEDRPDSKAIDRYVYSSLRAVINFGAELYNDKLNDKKEECYLHYRRTLEDLVPLLGHHPDLQKAVQTALSQVEKNPEWRVKMAAK